MNLYKMSFLLLSISLLVFFCYISCSDPASPGNKSPKITLKGKNPDTLSLNIPYVDSGAQAIDTEDGDISSKITVTGVVDFTKPGNYLLTYQVADSKGLSITATRTVTVINSTKIPTGLEDTIKASILSDTSFSNVTRTYRIISSRLKISGNVIFGRKTRFITNGPIEIITNGTLTIQEGVTVLFSENSNLSVTTGTLTIMGSDSLVVTLGPAANKYWGASGGILLSSTSTGISSINYCTIDSAEIGSNVAKDGLSITNSIFKNCETNGVVFGRDAGPKDTLSFIGNSFIKNGLKKDDYPLSLEANFIVRLPGNITFTENSNQAIFIDSYNGTIKQSGVITKQKVPYHSKSGFTVGDQLAIITVSPGVCFHLGGPIIVSSGTLIAKGLITDSIYFKNIADGLYWGNEGDDYRGQYGIRILSTVSNNCDFEFCVFDSATTGMLIGKDGLSIKNCTFRNAKHHGIYFDDVGPTDSAHFSENNFINCGTTINDYPLSINASKITRLSGNSIFSANRNQLIGVKGGLIDEPGIWRKHSVPYAFLGSASMNNDALSIQIQAGVKMRFAQSACLGIVKGTFIAEGTLTDSIEFKNLENGKFWGSTAAGNYGIEFESTVNANCKLTYCIIDSAKSAAIIQKDKLVFSNNSIKHSEHSGMCFDRYAGPKDSASFLENSFVQNGTTNTDYPLVIYDNFIIRLSGTGLFSGNSCQAIKTIGSCTISETGIWRKHTVPYDMYNNIACNNRIFSQSGVTITVQPGCKLRFSAENSINVYNQGAFIAVGTASDTIVMENLINGTTWGGIAYQSDCATTSAIQFCRISGAKTGVTLNNSPIPVSNSLITGCDLGIHMVKNGSSSVDTTSILFVANVNNTKIDD